MRAVGKTGLATLAAALTLAAPARAAEVEVVPISGPSTVVSLERLAGQEDVVERSYTVRSSQGDSTRTVTGFSLASVLEQGNVDGFTFSYVEIERPGGGALLLDNEQVRDAEGLDGPPVVFIDGGQARFLRPSTGAGDANAVDELADARLVVREREGALIRVEASATPVRVEAGEPIRFEATLTQAGAGQPVRFSWSFRDGAAAEGQRVTHRFARPGTYDVVVGATTPGDRTGGSDAVEVQVGEPKRGGPDRRGGGDNEDEQAPSSGQASGRGGAGEAGDAGAPAAGVQGGGEGAGQSPPDAPAQATEGRERRPTRGPRGPVVEGKLLSDLAEEPFSETQPERPEAGVAARAGTPADDSNFTVPGALVGVLVVGGLAGIGALAELERLRLPRRRGATA
jgi:hypothetical protein